MILARIGNETFRERLLEQPPDSKQTVVDETITLRKNPQVDAVAFKEFWQILRFQRIHPALGALRRTYWMRDNSRAQNATGTRVILMGDRPLMHWKLSLRSECTHPVGHPP
jgi:hypothetical protein